MRYILSTHPAEGSHNGSAAVLKTAGRKAMQVRVLSPPPFFQRLTFTYVTSNFGKVQKGRELLLYRSFTALLIHFATHVARKVGM